MKFLIKLCSHLESSTAFSSSSSSKTTCKHKNKQTLADETWHSHRIRALCGQNRRHVTSSASLGKTNHANASFLKPIKALHTFNGTFLQTFARKNVFEAALVSTYTINSLFLHDQVILFLFPFCSSFVNVAFSEPQPLWK